MVNVGCKFSPNDLEPRVWTELIALALERDRMNDLIQKGRDAQAKKGAPPPEADAAFRTARKELGVPEAGGALFPAKKPMR